MKVVICETYEELSKQVAMEVASQLKQKPASVLGLPTGDTPLGMYKQLIDMNKEGMVDFSDVTTFNLDEYVGIPKPHPCSYYAYMHINFFDQVNIAKENTHIPNGSAENPQEECAMYEDMIGRCKGIDLQLLGLGHNGHIGFNEPGSSFDTLTHVVDLTPSTIQANARFFDSIDDVPKKAMTMGVKSIMEARRIIIMVSGHSKAQAVYNVLRGEISTNVPASVLQMHPNACIMLDKEAAGLL